jgi:uncharacterized protein (TIGR03435 family)
MNRMLKLLARLYPSSWRNRYGVEFDALLEERAPRVTDLCDVFWGALRMHLPLPNLIRIVLPCGLAGSLMALGISFSTAPHYVSVTRMEVTSRLYTGVCGNQRELPAALRGPSSGVCDEPVPAVDRMISDWIRPDLSRAFLASLIEEKNLYPRERTKMPLDRVINEMQASIVITPERSVRAGSSIRVYDIKFEYSDPRIAQEVSQILVTHAIGASMRSSIAAIQRSGILFPPKPKYGRTFAIENPPSLPQAPTGLNRAEKSVMGLWGTAWRSRLGRRDQIPSPPPRYEGLEKKAWAVWRFSMRIRTAPLWPVASLAALFAFFSLATGIQAHGQILQGTGPLPSFEVATIKPDRGGPPPGFSIPPPNVFRNFNGTARDLVRVAYGLPPGPASTWVFGGPAWIDNNHYDVDAKIPDALYTQIQKMSQKQRRDQMLLMVQSLLADRFKLTAHIETREMPIYELVVAKGGPKLTLAKEPPSGADAPLPPIAPGTRPNPADMRQGLLVLPKTKNVMEMTAKGQTLDALAQMPFFGLGVPVVNKTGLTAKYDFTLDWTPDRGAAAANATDAPAEAEGPSLYTALEEQLGLKLVSTKGLVEVIVIDHIELPTEN